MCMAPIMIDNPNYNSPVRDPVYHIIHPTKSKKIAVPCGRCASCIHLKQVYLIQRVQMEAINHDLFYGTLTYNQESLPIAEIGDFRFAYPDFSDWQKMIKMVRKDYDFTFKYMLVTEYGGKKHRPHFHFILSFPKSGNSMAEKVSKAYQLFSIFLKYWRRNYGSTRSPIWKPLCTYVRKRIYGKEYYNYDLHYLDPYSSKDGIDGVSFYVTKYILKYDDWIDKFKSKLFFNLELKDYKIAWDLFRPRLLLSKGFGSPDDSDVRNHIKKGIDFAIAQPGNRFPFFISLQNGSTYPLSPYYSKKFLTIQDKIEFSLRCRDFEDDLSISDIDKFDKREVQLSQMRSFLKSRILEFDLDEITSINEFENGKFYEVPKLDKEFASSWQDFDDCRDSDCDDCDGIFYE